MRTLALAGAVAASLISAACTPQPIESHDGPPATQSKAQALFVNGDFDAGLNAWTVATYTNPGINYPPQSISDLNWNPGGFNATNVVAGPTMSQVPAGLSSAVSLRVPFFGNDAALVNELGNSQNVNTLEQSVTTTAADVDPADGKIHVRFALAPVLENPGHPVNAQPYFYVQLQNTTKQLTLFSTFNYSNQPGVPWQSDPASDALYTDWQAFDVAPGAAGLDIGDTVDLLVIASGCAYGGHYGEVFLDSFGSELPGLSIAGSAPAYANAGDNLTYTFLAKNGGQGPATDVTVNFTLPDQTSFVSANVPGGTCTFPSVGSAGVVTCNIGTLNGTSSDTFTVTVAIDPAASGAVSAGNYSIQADSVAPLIGPLVTTQISQGVVYTDLAATVSDGVAAVNWGQAVNYAITVVNNGPSDATGSSVVDTLPPELTGVTWTCAGAGGGACGAPSGSGTLATTADLPVGGMVTYVLSGTVESGSGTGSLRNIVTVTPPSGVTDSNPNNNVAVDTDPIGSLVLLTLQKDGSGTGTGTVVSSPAAINCIGTCTSAQGSFAQGSLVALNALPDPGSFFVGWSGACTGSSNPCVLTLSAAATVTASFTSSIPIIALVPNGNGTLTCDTPVQQGQSSVCQLAPAAGATLGSLVDNGQDVTAQVNGGTYTISNVTGVHTVVAVFVAPLGGQCAANTGCLSGFCVDGVCCNTSCTDECAACDVPGSVGTCSPVSGAPHGNRQACNSDGTSCGGTCDGTDTQACAYSGGGVSCGSNQCEYDEFVSAGTCDGFGYCNYNYTYCNGYSCNAQGCLSQCASDNDCADGTVCNQGQCDLTCQADWQCWYGGSCINGYCQQPTSGNGATCSLGSDCSSGNCVDGVCCDQACNGQCQACDVSGSVGTCSAVQGAPHGSRTACGSDGSTCAGTCDGTNVNACDYPASGTSCGSASCTNGSATGAAACDGNGDCVAPSSVSCGLFQCGASSCLSVCASDADCAAGAYCQAGACVLREGGGGGCTSADQCGSGYCVDGVCCDSACTGQCQACDVAGSIGTCSAVQGAPHGSRTACASDSSACGGACNGVNATACAYPTAACRAGSCSGDTATLAANCDGAGSCPVTQTQSCGSYQCGTVACLGNCTSDGDCQAGNYCAGGVCTHQLSNGGSCGGADQCQSGNCVDGVCCDQACNGQCQACDVRGSLGTCSPVQGAPHGGRAACATDGTVCGGACDGTQVAACAYPDAGISCRGAACANGLATLAAACDGAGACPALQHQACTPYVCGATGCEGNCTSDGDCISSDFCAAGVCTPKAGPGATCGAADQCQSGFCVDGVCCNQACDGQCQACDVSGHLGTCALVLGAPHGGRTACASDGTACGGACDGSNETACSYPGAATSCRTGSCNAGSATLPAACQGTGHCPAPQTQDCGESLCGASACLGNCSHDTDCKVGDFCSAGVCKPRQGNGSHCGGADACQSGFCVDGVCCNQACDGQCQACDVAGALGACSPVAGAPHGARTACTSDGSACGGACDGTNTDMCQYPGAGESCRAASCASGSATAAAACDGSGKCPAAQVSACGAYACGEVACLATCSADSDCSSGNYCLSGSCAARGDGKGWKGAGGGGCSTGAGLMPLALLVLGAVLLKRRRAAVGVAALAVLVSASARAQSSVSTAISVDRFQPLGGSQDVLGVESARVAGDLQWNVGAYFNYGQAPVRLLADGHSDLNRDYLQDQTTLDLVGSLALKDALEIGVAIPVTVSQQSQSAGMVDPELAGPVASGGVGDLRITPKVRLINRDLFQLAVAAPISLPTGDTSSFLGNGSPTFGPRAIVEYVFAYGIRGVANLGFLFQQQRQFLNVTVGPAVTFGFGAEAPFQLLGQLFAGQLTVNGEAVVVSGGAVPVEALAALRWSAPVKGLDVSVGGGPGLTSGLGTPRYRVFAGVAYRAF